MRYLTLLVSSVALCSAADFFTGQAARLVIGQPTFTAQEAGATASLLGGVSGLAYANNMLVVTDANRVGAAPLNHRVLIFKNLSEAVPAPTAELPPDAGRCPVCVGRATVAIGQPDLSKGELRAPDRNTVRLPTAVATDGRILVVADTDNNRVLIWNSIPTVNDQPADVVLGQPDFKRVVPNDGQGFTPTNRSFKGPQGVWIQGSRLFVADTQNNRVMIWNSIPTSNHAPADVVLGHPDFNTFVQSDLTKAVIEAKATTLLNPVSVTSDGIRLYVADLGHNRVLIWNSIPTRNQAPADVVLGQPNMESAIANNSRALCPARGTDANNNEVFPIRCSATMEFPRYALSDGNRLFVADGGNDRVLVYQQVPTNSGQAADSVLGQLNGELNQVSDSAEPLRISSADSVRTPMSLAWDGANLYVSDPYNRRVMVFTVGDKSVPNTGVRNAASQDIFAVAAVTLDGTVRQDDEITIKVKETEYRYKIQNNDAFRDVIRNLVERVNAGAGDPFVFATPNNEFNSIILTSKIAGEEGNKTEFSVTTSAGAQIVATTSGATLAGGQDAAKIAPGTLVSIVGENFTDRAESADMSAGKLPSKLAGVQVYFDGIRAPLLFAGPTQINAQVPVEVFDASSINAYVRTEWADGRVTISTPIAVPIISENPGIFAFPGGDPRPGVIMHGSSFAQGVVSVDGSVNAGDRTTVNIEDRSYSYTVQTGDTLEAIRNRLIERINEDPRVEAFPAGVFTRIRLRARVPGAEGNGISYSASTNDGAQVILTATNAALCCANEAGALVTEANPAVPGETIVVLATGLGRVQGQEARQFQITGIPYEGPEINEPIEFVSALAGGKTANVLSAGLKRGTVGIFEVVLELNSDIPTNPLTQLTIAQSFFVSNIVTLPVVNPNPPAETLP